MTKDEYQQLNTMLFALLTDEHDLIANMANASALLYEYLEDINWVGFYIYKEEELVLGPFQGKAACMHIPMGNGVCGIAAQTRTIQRIANVHEFPTHIACDSASNSELVIPLVKKDTLLGVLDIDSTTFHRFNDVDEQELTEFANILIQSL